jgi:anti-sigma regulatory factor (Ser/Thr protein kinase)
VNIARRTAPCEGTASERFPTHRGRKDMCWSSCIATSARLKSTRDQARQFLVANAVSPTCADDIVLTLSELLSNALASGQPGGTVTAALNCVHPHLVKLTVMNQSSFEPVSAFLPAITEMPGPEIDHGRGLPLVAALATRVSIDGSPTSTRVQADFIR